MTPPIRMVSVPVDGEGRSPIYTAAYDSIRKGAPGLSDATCQVIARSINMKLTAAPVREEGGAVTYVAADGATAHRLATREEAPAEAGEIDLYDDKVQAGIAWTMRQWGETLGLKTWTMGDGSESVEGDVGAEIHTILVDAGLRDPETNEMAALRAQPPAREEVGCAEPEVGRAVYERIERLLTDDPQGWERRYLSHLVESVEEVGSYDGPPAREDAKPVAWRWKTPIQHVGDGTRWGWTFASHPSTPPVSINPEPLYTHPAPDALRVALSRAVHSYDGIPPRHRPAWLPEALAALQAEQKGGA